MKDLVSLCITSYNRPEKLKDCVDSFFITNQYNLDYLELIIVDNGSTNPDVVDYIKSLSPPCVNYQYILNEKNDYPDCLRYAKIQAREIAKGEYFIDCPDDHLFVVSCDWISEDIQHIKSSNEIGCIVYYAFPWYRYNKSNNKMKLKLCEIQSGLPSALRDLGYRALNTNYYVSLYKGYSDYHIMSKKVYEKLGPYQLGKYAEEEYMERASSAGYYRNIRTWPVAIINDEESSCTFYSNYKIVEPISSSKIKNAYSGSFHVYNRPLNNQEMILFLTNSGNLKRIPNQSLPLRPLPTEPQPGGFLPLPTGIAADQPPRMK